MRIVLIFGVFICLLATACAEDDDDNLGFAEESSGGDEGFGNPEFPTDDEDMDDEGSGAATDANVVPVDQEAVDTDDEPEVTGTMRSKGGDKDDKDTLPSKSVKNINRINGPEEKDVQRNDLEDEESEGDERSVAKDAAGVEFMAAVVVGGCIGLLFAICVIMLLVYRMRKKDEGSYALEYGLDSKKPQGNYEYTKGVDSKEYFA